MAPFEFLNVQTGLIMRHVWHLDVLQGPDEPVRAGSQSAVILALTSISRSDLGLRYAITGFSSNKLPSFREAAIVDQCLSVIFLTSGRSGWYVRTNGTLFWLLDLSLYSSRSCLSKSLAFCMDWATAF